MEYEKILNFSIILTGFSLRVILKDEMINDKTRIMNVAPSPRSSVYENATAIRMSQRKVIGAKKEQLNNRILSAISLDFIIPPPEFYDTIITRIENLFKGKEIKRLKL
jgi:hypothetical protein